MFVFESSCSLNLRFELMVKHHQNVSTRSYSSSNLRVAIAKLPPGIIPPTLKDVQLLRVLYHCDDIYNSISGNAYCISGCISIDGSLENDQCYM
ncbi:unnamed protein product [Clonostachys rosea f. rosea IK726]|uniref:Uncharacterized protein n=2 Tax=Bionectria ochroleuca TaxID=29856 RepID=A0A0B7KST5_BIOOC|nr:unnamed protein product [Clonostachys rosea f. rosea IK726]